MTEQITLFKHTTDGGAVYLVDNHSFREAKIIISFNPDMGYELEKCEIELN